MSESKSTEKFRSLSAMLEHCMDMEIVEQCNQVFKDNFMNLSDIELQHSNIKNEAQFFIKGLITLINTKIDSRTECYDLIQILSCATKLISTPFDFSATFMSFLDKLCHSDDFKLIRQCDEVLIRFSGNKPFLNTFVTDEIISQYFILGIGMPEEASNTLYGFILNCMMKTTRDLSKFLILRDVILASYRNATPAFLKMAAEFYIRTKSDPPSQLNEAVVRTKDTTCYEILLSVNNEGTKVHFIELCHMRCKEIAQQLLVILSKHLDIPVPLIRFFEVTDSLDIDGQKLFLQLILKQHQSIREEMIKMMFPPWKSKIIYDLLISFAEQNINRVLSVECLKITLLEQITEDIFNAFNESLLNNLIITLIKKLDDDDDLITDLFNKISKIVAVGSEKALDVLEFIFRNFECPTYIESFQTNLQELGKSEQFIRLLPKLIKEISFLGKSLVSNQFLEYFVSNSCFDVVASIAADGPYELLDYIIQNSKSFDALSQDQLKKLISALPLDSTLRPSCIKIPSLIPKLEMFHPNSLLDIDVAGSYLLRNELIMMKDPLFLEIGKNYLTTKYANEVIDYPDILLKIIKPRITSSNIYQFQIERENSVIIYNEAKVTFKFYVEEYVNEFKLFEIGNNSIIYHDNTLRISNESILCPTKTWNEIIIKQNLMKYNILVNQRHSYDIEANNNKLFIGSMSRAPGSIFYVQLNETPVQVGSGMSYIQYKGFANYYKQINAIPRLFEKMLNSKTKEEILNYMQIILELQTNHSIEFLASEVLGMIRIILIEKHELISKRLINCLLQNVSNNWIMFRYAFIDYDLWKLCHKKLDSVKSFILSHHPNEHDSHFLSLFPFIFDLHSNFKIPGLSELLLNVFKHSVPNNKTFSIYFYYFSKISKEACLQFFRFFAETNNETINEKEFEKLITQFEPYLEDEEFWISMFIILTKVSFKTLDEYVTNEIREIARPEFIHLIINLICELFKLNSSELLLRVLNVLQSIISITNTNLKPFAKDIRTLLFFGCTSQKLVQMPVMFDSILSPRMEVDQKNYSVDMTMDISFPDFMSSAPYLENISHFFGIKNDVFTMTCDSILSIASPSFSPTFHELTVDELENCPAHDVVVQIMIQFFNCCSKEKLFDDLTNMLIFGSNVDPKVSIYIHRKAVLAYLKTNAPSAPLLSFIKEMVCTGWWEAEFSNLFNVICGSFSIDIQSMTADCYKELADVLELIYVITPDFGDFDFEKYNDLLFSDSLVANETYINVLYSSLRMHNVTSGSPLWSRLNNCNEDTCLATYAQFCEKETLKLSSRNDKLKAFRNKLILKYFPLDISNILKAIVKFTYETRYNIISRSNENLAFKLWSFLPQQIPTKYQIATSVHPISAPTLYVPLATDVDVDNFKVYPIHNIILNEEGASSSPIPPCVSSYVSRYYYQIDNSLMNFLITKKYGNIIQLTPVRLLFGSQLIESVIIQFEDCYKIMIEATISAQNQVQLEKPKDNIVTVTFINSCVSRYYGECDLFFGHALLSFKKQDILISVQRMFLHENKAMEVWFDKGYSLFLVFNSNIVCNNFVSLFRAKSHLPPSKSHFSISFSAELCKMVRKHVDLQQFRVKWIKNDLSSFEYLLILNFFADRSFTNMSQYPVMPWVNEERDISKPMGQQTDERGSDFADKYQSSGPDYHLYGSLYSSPAVIYHFMIRIQPYTIFHIDLQDGYDAPERIFSDMTDEWETASQISTHNVEELIPEVFMLPEIFMNKNNLQIPNRASGQSISNVVLPYGCPNWVSFVWNMRQKLENVRNLEKWIDLIFGSKSRGENAVDSLNLFYPTVYGKMVSVVTTDELFEEIKRNFGQVPSHLFTEDHPGRDTICSSRCPILTKCDSIFNQTIKSFSSNNCNDQFLIEQNGTLGFKSAKSIFSSFRKNIDSLTNCKFSNDDLLFCASTGSGSMKIYRAICSKQKKIVNYELIAYCVLPAQFVTDDISCLTISSHLNLVCECSKNNLFTYHISSQKLIRIIEFKDELIDIFINDSHQMIFGVSKNSIEVFTVNGTHVAYTTADSVITCGCLSVNDFEFFLATGHEDGKIRLWSLDCERETLKQEKEINLGSKVRHIGVLSYGSALVAMGEQAQRATLFVSRGIMKSLVTQANVSSCAKCGRNVQQQELRACKSCGLFYCSKCVNLSGSVMCLQCLENIEECANLSDDDFIII